MVSISRAKLIGVSWARAWAIVDLPEPGAPLTKINRAIVATLASGSCPKLEESSQPMSKGLAAVRRMCEKQLPDNPQE